MATTGRCILTQSMAMRVLLLVDIFYKVQNDRVKNGRIVRPNEKTNNGKKGLRFLNKDSLSGSFSRISGFLSLSFSGPLCAKSGNSRVLGEKVSPPPYRFFLKINEVIK